jgi:alpha-tubulin suppressor-like RCC1 family protein
VALTKEGDVYTWGCGEFGKLSPLFLSIFSVIGLWKRDDIIELRLGKLNQIIFYLYAKNLTCIFVYYSIFKTLSKHGFTYINNI